MRTSTNSICTALAGLLVFVKDKLMTALWLTEVAVCLATAFVLYLYVGEVQVNV